MPQLMQHSSPFHRLHDDPVHTLFSLHHFCVREGLTMVHIMSNRIECTFAYQEKQQQKKNAKNRAEKNIRTFSCVYSDENKGKK